MSLPKWVVPLEYSPFEEFVFHSTVKWEQVERIINGMSANKASGIDKVPIRVIKDSLPAILPWITSIINASFKLATFPSRWKIAEVTPILKDGDHEIPNNNRPISPLPVLSKVCERAAHDQLVSFLSTKQRLSTQQCGNKKWNSTETALIQTTDSILQNIDKKELTAAVLLDMRTAFDSINHDILIMKLRDVGLPCSSIEWFKSYLSSRYQVEKIQASISDQLPVTSSVPQGSILGPLLFGIYTNDLSLVPKHCSIQSYVDVTKLLLNARLKDRQNIVSKMNEDLQRICQWTFTNKLLLNTNKTKFVIFGSRPLVSKVEGLHLSLLGKELTPAKSAKDLGVILDSNLTYEDHVTKTVSTCMSRLGQINRVKHVLGKDTLTIVVNCLVFSNSFTAPMFGAIPPRIT